MRASGALPADAVGRVPLPAILALLSFAMMIVSLDQYIVVVALPIRSRPRILTATLESLISAYAIASSGFLLLGGRASILLGRRRCCWSASLSIWSRPWRRPRTQCGRGVPRARFRDSVEHWSFPARWP